MTATRERVEPPSAQELADAGDLVSRISAAFAHKVVGQDRLRQTLLLALTTGGHVLLESVPGLAKTTGAQTLADSVAASFKRIQCTPDLLPSDLIGTQIYDASTGSFSTVLGPVHANIVLLDEINRSSAKTQSAMLEAMAEGQTTIGGHHHRLPAPFLVVATQNPIEQEGTYQLPEAQLDRFMFKDVLDYPSPAEEAAIIGRVHAGVYDTDRRPGPLASLEQIRHLQSLAGRVYLDPSLVDYIVALVSATRHPRQHIEARLAGFVEFGASPRAGICLSAAARALALINGRGHVLPEDVKALAHRILRHRIILGFEAMAEDVSVDVVVDAILSAVRTP